MKLPNCVSSSRMRDQLTKHGTDDDQVVFNKRNMAQTTMIELYSSQKAINNKNRRPSSTCIHIVKQAGNVRIERAATNCLKLPNFSLDVVVIALKYQQMTRSKWMI